MNALTTKCGCFGGLLAATLVVTSAVKMFGDEPEMWVVPLEKKIPSTSPDGHTVTSLEFVLRVRGAVPYEAVSFFDTVHIKVFTSAGEPLVAENIGSIRLPQNTDYVPLIAKELIGKAYDIHLRGRTLIFFDRCGNALHFEGATKGKFTVEITFDDTREHSIRIASEFEDKHYSGEDKHFFFRGPKKMSFGIEIGENTK